MDDFFDILEDRLIKLADKHAKLQGAFNFDQNHIALREPMTLTELEHFFAELFGVDADLPDIPMGNARLVTFKVARAQADIGLPLLVDLAVDFNGEAKLEVAPEFEIELTTVSLRYWGGDWSGTIAGQITFREMPFQISLDWPSMVIEGSLVDDAGTGIMLERLVKQHDLSISRGSPRLTGLNILAMPRSHYVKLAVEAEDLLHFGPVKLDDVLLEIEYRGGPNAAFNGRIASSVSAGHFVFQLEAEKQDKNWTAKAYARGETTVRQAIETISHDIMGSSHDLTAFGVPDDLADKPVKGEISISFASRDRHVTLALSIDVSNGKGVVDFEIDVSKKGLKVKAVLTLEDLEFEVDFAKQGDTKVLAARFESEDGLKISVSELIKLSRLSDGDSIPDIGADLSITLKDMLVAMAKGSDDKTKFLLAADLDGGIDLSGLGDLPLIGTMLPNDSSIRLSLAPVLLNTDWKDDRAVLADLVGSKGPELPDPLDKSKLGVSLKLPGLRAPQKLGLEMGPTDGGAQDVPVEAPPAPAPDAPPEPVKWMTVNKSLGPISVQRIGLGLDRDEPTDPRVRMLLDASLGLGGVELSLVGLGGHYGLKSKEMGFELQGMGLEVKRPPLEIGAAFALINGDYLGKARIQMKTFGLAASGGFAMIGKTPSMFLYGVLNTPIGGPPFFFVEGLAAGFGFNRDFIAPELKDVHSFPFVVDAISASKGGSRKTGSIAEELAILGSHVKPKLGQYFLAAGVKFTSFKILESFVLLVVSAGRDFKIDVLGVSTFQNPPLLPPDMPAMVKIELDLRASIRPTEGSLLVQAALGRDSYVYSPLVRLSGGFAFASWFGGPHAGDFVITAGGYHPRFKKPNHYPSVDRIKLEFKVPGVDLSISGSAYFALTPSMMMAGGALHAHGEFASVSVSFEMGLDLLITWEPYHYEVDMHVRISAEWGWFSTHASADLKVWGPEFGGTAHVSWSIISFDVDFGPDQKVPPPIAWSKFKDSFLPHADDGSAKVAPTVSVTKGLLGITKRKNQPDLHRVDARELEILVDGVLPARKVNNKIVRESTGRKKGQPLASPGCLPMAVSALETAELTASFDNLNNRFDFQPQIKSFPAAMWGPSPKPSPAAKMLEERFGMTVPMKPNLKADALVRSGGAITVTPKPTVKPTGEFEIDRTEAAYHEHDMNRVAAMPALSLNLGTATKAEMTDALLTPSNAAAKRRDAIFEQLGLDPSRDGPEDDMIHELRGMPMLAKPQRRR